MEESEYGKLSREEGEKNKKFIKNMIAKANTFLNKSFTVAKVIVFLGIMFGIWILLKYGYGNNFVNAILLLYALAFYMLFNKLDSIQEQFKKL